MTHTLMPATSSSTLIAAVPSLPSPVVLAYIAAAILFILAAAGLSRHETAVAGNVAGAVGMGVAVLAAMGLALSNHPARGVLPTLLLIAMGLALGSVIGLVVARRVAMTGMPQLIAVLNGLVGLAAVLAPLLILFGVKFGVVETLTERLRNDPATLEISPVGSGHFSAADMDRWRDDGRVAFVMPRTRTLAATVELLPERGTPLHVSMEPTGHEDPLLARHALPVPALLLDSEDDPDHPGRLRTRAAASGVVLSAPVAERLGLRAGDQLTGRLERTRNGKVQAVRLPLKVIGVLPLAAQQKNVVYVPLPFLEAAEDYRDGRAVPLFGPEHAADGDQPPAERLYAGFRLYARSLDDVAPLRDFFQQQGITVHTEAEAIDQVRRLSTSLDIIFLLIGGAAAAGFTASTTSSTLAAVRRKQRLLGLLRLGGFSTLELLLFPLLQALLTAVLGTGLALGLYAAAQGVVNRIFAAGLDDMEHVCRLLPEHAVVTLVLVCLLSLLAALLPSLRGARTEPSEVIREI